MAKPTTRVAGHALRWGTTEWSRAFRQNHPDSAQHDDYDPFDPRGPWTAECECGWTQQVVTKRQGMALHGRHKLAEEARRG